MCTKFQGNLKWVVIFHVEHLWNDPNQNYDTCIQASPVKKSQDLGASQANDHAVELPSPWEKGGGDLGTCIQHY